MSVIFTGSLGGLIESCKKIHWCIGFCESAVSNEKCRINPSVEYSYLKWSTSGEWVMFLSN